MPSCGHPLIVAVTGWGAASDRKRSSMAGFDRHLTKPVAGEELTKLLDEARVRR
jgi:CheY-like chemotaxis protein